MNENWETMSEIEILDRKKEREKMLKEKHIKQLVWKESGGVWSVKTPVGNYDLWEGVTWVLNLEGDFTNYKTKEDAQEFAQKDFEKKVKECFDELEQVSFHDKIIKYVRNIVEDCENEKLKISFYADKVAENSRAYVKIVHLLVEEMIKERENDG